MSQNLHTYITFVRSFVRPSVRPSVRLPGGPSVRPSARSLVRSFIQIYEAINYIHIAVQCNARLQCDAMQYVVVQCAMHNTATQMQFNVIHCTAEYRRNVYGYFLWQMCISSASASFM